MEQFITDFQQALKQKQLKYNLWQPMLFYKDLEKLLNLMRDPNELRHTDPTDYTVLDLHDIASIFPSANRTIEKVLADYLSDQGLVYDNRLLRQAKMSYRAIMLDAKADYFFNWYPEHLDLARIKYILHNTKIKHPTESDTILRDDKRTLKLSEQTDITARCLVFVNQNNEIILALPIMFPRAEFRITGAKLTVIPATLAQIADILDHEPLFKAGVTYSLAMPFVEEQSYLNYGSEVAGFKHYHQNEPIKPAYPFIGDTYTKTALEAAGKNYQNPNKKKKANTKLLKTLHINYAAFNIDLILHYLMPDLNQNDQLIFKPKEAKFAPAFAAHWQKIVDLFAKEIGTAAQYVTNYVNQYSGMVYCSDARPYSRHFGNVHFYDDLVTQTAIYRGYAAIFAKMIPKDAKISSTNMIPVPKAKMTPAFKPLATASGLNDLIASLQENNQHQYYLIRKQDKLRIVSLHGHHDVDRIDYLDLN